MPAKKKNVSKAAATSKTAYWLSSFFKPRACSSEEMRLRSESLRRAWRSTSACASAVCTEYSCCRPCVSSRLRLGRWSGRGRCSSSLLSATEMSEKTITPSARPSTSMPTEAAVRLSTSKWSRMVPKLATTAPSAKEKSCDHTRYTRLGGFSIMWSSTVPEKLQNCTQNRNTASDTSTKPPTKEKASTSDSGICSAMKSNKCTMRRPHGSRGYSLCARPLRTAFLQSTNHTHKTATISPPDEMLEKTTMLTSERSTQFMAEGMLHQAKHAQSEFSKPN